MKCDRTTLSCAYRGMRRLLNCRQQVPFCILCRNATYSDIYLFHDCIQFLQSSARRVSHTRPHSVLDSRGCAKYYTQLIRQQKVRIEIRVVCHAMSGGQSLAFVLGSPGSIPGKSIRGLWCTKWHRNAHVFLSGNSTIAAYSSGGQHSSWTDLQVLYVKGESHKRQHGML